ncbi:hypothetical protein GCM10009001_33750 [Virgibacillus siamensis]|uniref:EfeO-type cupredoxin-like domain-containing protein n=1 Tax=Virgibacillus siamensis TaxID=480071 RepID=A0ABN1GL19_9BACI
MKKLVIALGILLIIMAGSYYFYYTYANAELTAENTTASVHADDFVLHVRVEKEESGFRVFRSIQYVGEGEVRIVHQTPLISVSFRHKNHDYTGSTVSEALGEDSNYHPQDPKHFESPKKGEYTLYCKAKFSVDGEEKKITHSEKLTFN